MPSVSKRSSRPSSQPRLASSARRVAKRPKSAPKLTAPPLAAPAPKSAARPLVSVIIPAFNARVYLKEAIDSVLNQTYGHVEVVVVDDGSTDGTKDALTHYLEEGLIEYYFQENRGLAGARDTGIRKAKGRYIAFLDADDIYLPTKIERQVNYLEYHPTCDVCYCDLWHFYEEEPAKMRSLQYAYHSGEQVFPRLLQRNFINPLTVMFRRSVFERFGYFDESYRRSEDWEFWVRLAYQGVQFCFLPEKLAKYRMRRASGLSYNPAGEVWRKQTTYDIFVQLTEKMSKDERRKYKMGRVLLRHRFKLFYAKLTRAIPLLWRIQLWRQKRRLK